MKNYKKTFFFFFFIIFSCKTDKNYHEKVEEKQYIEKGSGNKFIDFCKNVSSIYKEKLVLKKNQKKYRRKLRKEEKKNFLVNLVKRFLNISFLENQKKIEAEYYRNKELYFKDPEKDTIKARKEDDVKLRIFIMGAFPSKDKFGNIIRKRSVITYSYHIIGELTNFSKIPINKRQKLYLDLRILFREKRGIGHIEYKREKYFLSDLYDFKNFGSKIKLPIQSEGGQRIFELKIHEIPESEHRVNLILNLRDSKKLWSRHFISLFKPPPPPIKEKFFDFLSKPSSTKWWYLTLGFSVIAIIIAVLALI